MANTVEIMELYTAYFNRAADKAGVDYWANEMDANGWTLDQVAQSFADQPEYQAIYGNLTNEGTIVEIYKNLLNREPDAAGLAYWEEQLDSGAIQISNMVQAIINGAQGSDIAIIDNKTAVSQYAYDAGLEATDAKTISLENITADPSTIASAKAAIDAINPANVGETFTLTTSPSDILVGTDKNDTFEGLTAASGTTAQSTDTIIDQSTTDNDTANLTLNGALPTMKIVNVENVNLTIAATGSVNNDVSALSGVKNLTITKTDLNVAGSTIVGNKDVAVTNLDATKVAKVTVAGTAKDVSVNQSQTTVTDSKTGVVVNADVATGAVNVVGAATVNAGAATGNVTVTALNAASSATFTQNDKAVVINAGTTTGIVTVAASVGSHKFGGDITVNADKAATVTINNDADNLTDTNAVSGAVVVNAAKATSVTVDDATWGATVTAATDHGTAATINVAGITSKGATITSGTGTTTNGLTIELDGTSLTNDVATVSAAGVVKLDVAKSTAAVDTINVSGNGADVTYTLARSQASDITTLAASGDYKVNVTTDSAYVSGKTVTGVETLKLTAAAGDVNASKFSATTLELGYNLNGNKVTLANGANVLLSTNSSAAAKFATNSVGDAVTLKVGDTNGTANTATPTYTATTLDLTGIAGTTTTAGSVTLDATTGGVTLSTGVDGTANVDLVVTGTKAVNLGTVKVLKSVDASALTGKLTVTALNSGSATVGTIKAGTGGSDITLNEGTTFTVTGGTGVDEVTLTKVSANTVLSLGAGNDVVKTLGAAGSQGAIVIATGEGDDEVQLVGVSDAIISFGEGTSDQLTVTSNADLAAYAAGAYTYQNFAFTGVEKVNIATGATLTLSATQIANDNTFALSGSGALEIEGNLSGTDTGTGVASTIDLSGITRASGVTATVTVTGSSKADTITGTSGNDTIKASAGADVIVGGDGTDTYDASAFGNLSSGVQVEGASAGTMYGVVINLGSTAVSNTAVLAATGLYTADSLTSVAAGTVAYEFSASGSTNSAVVQSISGIETVIGTSGKDYIVAGSAGNTITGGAGADTIVLGAGADTVVFSDAASNGSDTIKSFNVSVDKLNLDALTTDNTTAGVDGSAFVAFNGANTAAADTIISTTGASALTTTTAAALFEIVAGGDAGKMVIADNKQVLLVNQDNSGTDFGAQIFVVSSDGANITATLVGTLDGVSTLTWADIA